MADRRAARAAAEHMPAVLALGVDEVQVIPLSLQPARVVREAEADDGAGHVGQLEDVLVREHLEQRADTAGTGAGPSGPGPRSNSPSILIAQLRLRVCGDLVDPCQQVGRRRSAASSSSSSEGSNQAMAANGVRSVGSTSVDQAVDVGAVEATVERDHLAVERVQRPEPEVAVLGELVEGDVAVERALQQRTDRRGLKEGVRLVLWMQVAMAQRLDVQAAGEPLVEGHSGCCSGSGSMAAAG